MIKIDGKKLTPKQAAKLIVEDGVIVCVIEFCQFFKILFAGLNRNEKEESNDE